MGGEGRKGVGGKGEKGGRGMGEKGEKGAGMLMGEKNGDVPIIIILLMNW